MKIVARTLRAILLLTLIMSLICSCKKDNTPSTIQPVSIRLSESSVNLAVGGREKLFVFVEPSNADLSKVIWASADTNIVKVDKDGIATAISVGETNITYKTDNNLVQQCAFKVVSSPVSGIVLPQANYPIGNGLKFIILGTGFSTSDKIWFRKASYSASGIKSTLDGDDILGEINELAGNYINVSGGAENGWYSVYVEIDGKLYNIGNLQFSTYQVPPFVYDPNKNFWDDTHLRWMQLRGKVKEMKVKMLWSFLNGRVATYDYYFNNKGYLSSKILGWASQQISYEYDSQNRIKSSVSKTFGGNTIESCSYLYGSSDKYFHVDPIYELFGSQSGYYSYWEWMRSDPGDAFAEGIWIKGLKEVKSVDFETNRVSEIQYNVFSDSVIFDENRFKVKDYSSFWRYEGQFANEEIRKWNDPNFDPGGYYRTLVQFSASGMPVKYSSYQYSKQYNNISTYDSIQFVSNSPFHLYSVKDLECSECTTPNTFQYDQNWNLIEQNYSSSMNNVWFSDRLRLFYTSYDKYGNWTQCITIEEAVGDNLYSPIIIVFTRDFTYWE